MDGRTTRDDLLPGPPGPPDDPAAWLLDARTGWRASRLAGVVAGTGPDRRLRLARRPGAGLSLADPAGSLGGLVPPRTVALGPTGDVYLLDVAGGLVKRFDPCACRFDPVPCLGGIGHGPRQVRQPVALAIHGGDLYVVDRGAGRVAVFALRGAVLRGFWAPPAGALAQPWEPAAIAFDWRGRAHVADPANGCVHRFGCGGRWERGLGGFGAASQLAFDRDGCLHVLVGSAPPLVRVADADGRPLGEATAPEELAGRFPPLPFAVGPKGQLHLGPLCQPPLAPTAGTLDVFDAAGNLVRIDAPPPEPVYLAEGTYRSAALDSELYRCRWHRLVLSGELPPGTSVEVRTYTAETEQPDAFIDVLDLDAPDVWATRQVARATEGGDWDCLVQSGGGRYLWLHLTLRGNGLATPALERVRLEFPRISLRRYLPAVFGAEPTSADFTDRFLAIFDTTLRGIEATLDHQHELFDPRSAPAKPLGSGPADFLSWLGGWIGVALDPRLPIVRRRALLGNAGQLAHLRGTREGLWRQLLVYLGLKESAAGAWRPPPLILEHYRLRRWLFLAQGRLGDDAMLWGRRVVSRSQLDENAQSGITRLDTTRDPLRDPFHVYAHRFSVFVPACFVHSAGHRKALERLIRAERPAHTMSQLVAVEPRFRIGVQSMVGLDSVVGRYPQGITLDGQALGAATVLGPAAHHRGGPSLAIGWSSRIEATTALD
jgi:phage tail-like protein